MASKYFNHHKSGKIPRTSQWRQAKQIRIAKLKRNLFTINNEYQNTRQTQIKNDQIHSESYYDYDESNPSFIEQSNINLDPIERLQQIRIENEDNLTTREHKKELIQENGLNLQELMCTSSTWKK